MKYGMNLLLWTGEMHDGMLPVLESLKTMGYDGVELPMFDLDVDAWAKWGKRLDDLGLQRTAVTVRGEDDNPISPDAAVRAQGRANTTSGCLDCCHAVGAETLLGPFHSALGLFSGQGPTPDEWKWGVESMRQVAEHAGQTGVMLARRISESLRDLPAELRGRYGPLRARRRPPQLPDDVRYVPRQHRRKITG